MRGCPPSGSGSSSGKRHKITNGNIDTYNVDNADPKIIYQIREMQDREKNASLGNELVNIVEQAGGDLRKAYAMVDNVKTTKANKNKLRNQIMAYYSY